MRDNLVLVMVIGIVLSVRLAVQAYRCYKPSRNTYIPRYQDGNIAKLVNRNNEIREYYNNMQEPSMGEQIDIVLRDAQRVLRDGVSLEEGITSMLRNKPAYRPYHIKEPIDDIRNAMREFTVGEVVQTFYI